MNNLNTFSNDATRQIVETVRTVQAMPSNPRQGNKGTQRIYKARLTATINDPAPPNDPIIYQFEAEQVYFDGSAWTAVPNGVTWDSDVILYVFDSGVVGDIVTAEPLSNGANSTIWTALKPAGGGGSSLTWIKTDADETDGTGTGTVYAYRGSVTPLQEGDPLANIVVTWNAPDVASKGTIKAGNWFCCTENAGVYYPINIPVVL